MGMMKRALMEHEEGNIERLSKEFCKQKFDEFFTHIEEECHEVIGSFVHDKESIDWLSFVSEDWRDSGYRGNE